MHLKCSIWFFGVFCVLFHPNMISLRYNTLKFVLANPDLITLEKHYAGRKWITEMPLILLMNFPSVVG